MPQAGWAETLAHRSVEIVSATLCSAGPTLANMTVLEQPPRLSFSSIVSGEERNGTWPFPGAREEGCGAVSQPSSGIPMMGGEWPNTLGSTQAKGLLSGVGGGVGGGECGRWCSGRPQCHHRWRCAVAARPYLWWRCHGSTSHASTSHGNQDS